VIWMTIRRLRVGENLDVVDDIPRVAIDTYREELLAVGASGGHPNLIAPDDGRRPALVVYGGLPANVFRLAPAHRQRLGGRNAVAGRPAELRPVVPGRQERDGEEKRREC